MEETVFFDDGNIKVTNSRFIVTGKTYALSAVNSFRVDRVDETPNREIYKILVFGLVFALIAALANGSSLMLIVTVLAIGGIIWWGVNAKEKIKYTLLLTTSSGEAEALSSYTPGQIQEIETALTQAIVHRG